PARSRSSPAPAAASERTVSWVTDVTLGSSDEIARDARPLRLVRDGRGDIVRPSDDLRPRRPARLRSVRPRGVRLRHPRDDPPHERAPARAPRPRLRPRLAPEAAQGDG